MRLKSLSPVGRRPSEIPKKDIDTGQMVLEDSAYSIISPSINEEGLDFFVKIYTLPREENTESMRRETDDGKNGSEKGGYCDPWGLETYSAKDGDETEVQNEGERYAESLPDDPAYSAISFEDNINGDTDFVMKEMDASMFFLEYNQKEEIEDRDSLPSNTDE
ncbi:hypothetical protein, partial [Ralstonia pseudosolanacearum]|uniref:hypothetical protein n=1 Tax=Ralstonia pseudosolanacearum TaxID=1310165 RepID=UPI003CF324C8